MPYRIIPSKRLIACFSQGGDSYYLDERKAGAKMGNLMRSKNVNSLIFRLV